MARSEDKYTAEDFYELGRGYYKLAVEFENIDEPQEKIDASWGIAATNFWLALTIGSEKAPLALSKCFGQGVGVKKDEDIEKLLYGTALKLTPQDCAKIPAEEKLEIPKSMKPRIDALVKLVKDAHSKIPTKGVDMEVVDNQMTKFNNAIKLPFGKLIQSCFTKKITQDRAKKQDLKSKALELTKNLPIHNKATANTINHLSRKAKASLGTGCGIL